MFGTAVGGHPDLWDTPIPDDRGPEGNLKMWNEAEDCLNEFCEKTAPMEDAEGGEGAHCAQVDAWSRCVEERRRAQDLLALHEWWCSRPIGGVVEPVIAPKPKG